MLDEQKTLLNQLLNDPSLSSEATAKLKKDLDELNIKITGVKTAMKGGDESDKKKVVEENDTEKGNLDILGFSAKDWENAWKNLDTTKGKIQAVKMIVQSLSSAFQSFAQLQQNLANSQMSKFEKDNSAKKKELLRQLNEGLISQTEYNKKVQLLETETANKKAEISYKQAKVERALKVAEIVASTSLAIMQAYSQLGPIGGTIAAVVIGTLGAIQLGTVMSTPLPDKPSFARGGFTGKGYGAPDETGFKKAGDVHEGEYVAPKWMVEHPRHAKVFDYLESVREGKNIGYAEGGYVTTTTTADPSSSINPKIESENQNNYLLQELLVLLRKLDQEGVIAYMIANEKNGKLIKTAVKKSDKIETRNARK